MGHAIFLNIANWPFSVDQIFQRKFCKTICHKPSCVHNYILPAGQTFQFISHKKMCHKTNLYSYALGQKTISLNS